MNLSKGSAELSIETISKPGSSVMDFKHIRLELQEGKP